MKTTDSTEEDIDSETALRRSTVLERMTEGIVALDADLRYNYVNDRAEELLGSDREQLLGERVWDAFPEGWGTVAQEKIEASMATQEQRSFERYNSERDRWFKVRIYPDESGLSIYFSDITERKKLEEERKRTNRQLTALIENTSQAMYLKDREGRYQFMNEAAATLFGLEPEDAVGKRDEDLFDAKSASWIREVDEQILEREETDSRESTRYIDGEEHVFLDNKYPYHDDDGEVVGIMGISRNITDRKREQRTLEELVREYHALLDNADDAIFLLDVDEGESGVEIRFERLNPYHEAATGLTTEGVRGKTPREAIGPELGAELEANYRRCVETGGPISYQETLQFPEGTRTWETKLAPVVIDGEVTRIIGIARDVTDRVEQEEALRRQNERLDEFAGVVAHDLRNPLSIAQGRTTLAVEELAREGYESPHLQKAQEALGRMEDIITDTLVLAKRGGAVESPEPVPLAEIIGQCWDMVETDGASLVVVDECTIAGDPDRLRHVCENLFRNAVEHGGDDVTVRVGRADDATLYVEDDGPGIPPERREAVFTPGETSQEDGTGFGLAIVKRIAEAHGWDVTLTEADSGGARFEFSGVEVLSS